MLFFLRLTIIAVLLFVSGFSFSSERIKIYTSDMPPWSMKGKSGIFMDLLREISKKLPYEFEVTVVPWSRAQTAAIKSDKCLIMPISRTKKREGLYQWIEKIMTCDISFVSINGKSYDLESARSLDIVVVHKDTAPHEILKREKFKNVHPVAVGGGFPEKILFSNRAEAWFSGVDLAKYYFKKLDSKKSLTVGPPVLRVDIYIAAINLPKDQILHIRTALKSALKNDVVKNIIEKYTR